MLVFFTFTTFCSVWLVLHINKGKQVYSNNMMHYVLPIQNHKGVCQKKLDIHVYA